MTGGYRQVRTTLWPPCPSVDIRNVSAEVQMRRPNKDRYRLDRLLERKAKEGIKIYIIL